MPILRGLDAYFTRVLAGQCWVLATQSGERENFLRLFENDEENRVGLISLGLLAIGAASNFIYFSPAQASPPPPLRPIDLPAPSSLSLSQFQV
jgi:hypothetical protein